MARQNIEIGSNPNDRTGDPARVWAAKTNQNFTELFQRYALINGNEFEIKKKLGNTTKGLFEVGDVALNGFWDENEFWKVAIFLGGDQNVKSNWNVIESI